MIPILLFFFPSNFDFLNLKFEFHVLFFKLYIFHFQLMVLLLKTLAVFLGFIKFAIGSLYPILDFAHFLLQYQFIYFILFQCSVEFSDAHF